ncbi:hypothetical protein G9H64_02450 [Aquirufa nivalisilvae]|uniref:hypothetical protein n=1 Tax=Aquirufa nivalisilvae TaxID=2516557 RepID=UPI001032B0C8|nr:hypothetical protein [Aquirufa nivalisilvae]MCZ2481804.1 hypothetical protein [Aquirufa nivalisilvae]TBH76120.1 hypothetical protein EWU22_00820 [Aquirufa nivalisilvae]
MKTWLASILFVIIFSGSWIPKVGMEQSFKANELLKHFQDHKRQAPAGFSFMDFLWMHYAADSKHAKTTKHPSLPSFDFSGVSGYVLPTISLVFLLPLLFVSSRRQLINWQNLYHFSLARVLIAPPRY